MDEITRMSVGSEFWTERSQVLVVGVDTWPDGERVLTVDVKPLGGGVDHRGIVTLPMLLLGLESGRWTMQPAFEMAA